MKDQRTGKIGIERHPLVVELIAKGLTAGEIADQLNVNPETVRKFARKRGYKIQREQMTMDKHPSWTGGVVADRSGYLLKRVESTGEYGYLIRAIQKRGYLGTDTNGYAPIHRIVMHNKLGRKLQAGEVVDHIDGNNKNNEPSNLRIFSSNSEHLRETLKGKIPDWTDEGKAKMTGRPINPNSENQKRLAKRAQSKSDGQA